MTVETTVFFSIITFIVKWFCFNVADFHSYKMKAIKTIIYSIVNRILTILINLPMLFTSLHINAL